MNQLYYKKNLETPPEQCVHNLIVLREILPVFKVLNIKHKYYLHYITLNTPSGKYSVPIKVFEHFKNTGRTVKN